MNARRNHLWLALRCRDLPLSALAVDTEPGAAAAVADQRRVVFCNPAARALGIARDMDLATVQLLGGCHILPRDRAREDAALRQLREHLYRFTPHIEIHRGREAPQSGLLLEISTCLRLHAGVGALCEAVLASLSTIEEVRGHEVRPGLAHTAQGAWLLTFARHDISGGETRDLFIERLNLLPVQVLYEHHRAVDALVKMGFSTLGDVVRQIRANAMGSFARRLGREFAAHIAEIYDMEGDFSQASLFARPVGTYEPEAYFRGSLSFDYPVTRVEQLEPAFESLLQQLSEFLRQRQLACQNIQWRLSDIYRNRETVEVHSDIPQSGWQLLYDLTLIAFDKRPIPFEVDRLELSCRDRLSVQSATPGLDFEGEGRQRGCVREQAVTMAKLKARLGEAAVYKVSYRDSLVPELSQQIIDLAEKCVQQLPGLHRHSPRPAWLLAEPQAVEQRGGRLYWQGYLKLAVGPERVLGHWWEDAVARDYYLARRQDNVAVWLFRDLRSRQWYVHGVFS